MVSVESRRPRLCDPGLQTGIDLPTLLETAAMMRDLLGRPLGSHVLLAGPIEWSGEDADALSR